MGGREKEDHEDGKEGRCKVHRLHECSQVLRGSNTKDIESPEVGDQQENITDEEPGHEVILTLHHQKTILKVIVNSLGGGGGGGGGGAQYFQ